MPAKKKSEAARETPEVAEGPQTPPVSRQIDESETAIPVRTTGVELVEPIPLRLPTMSSTSVPYDGPPTLEDFRTNMTLFGEKMDTMLMGAENYPD
jgi:hypothetical protein